MNAIKVNPKNINGLLLYLSSRYCPTYKAIIMGTAIDAPIFMKDISPSLHQRSLVFDFSLLFIQKKTALSQSHYSKKLRYSQVFAIVLKQINACVVQW